ncbi:Hypothetical predicted protein [Octopus vulgaris]|uniref:Uncharacterized protein n=1 Tax=Octopus vulgaris TaxID=6645 RepID=A0AA36BHN6_OCTVU|nr:Hypothetical predicted protein [Octopus vulgaris]
MDAELFQEFKEKYAKDIHDVSEEMAGKRFTFSPATTLQKEKDGEVAEFVQSLPPKLKMFVVVVGGGCCGASTGGDVSCCSCYRW